MQQKIYFQLSLFIWFYMKNKNIKFDLIIVLLFSVTVYIFSAEIDLLEIIADFSRDHEKYEIDEFLPTIASLAVGLIYFSIRRLSESRKCISNYKKVNKEIKILRGIIPICSICKKIRDDKGYWNQLESYMKKHSEAEFSHGLCPDCAEKYYPDVNPYK